MDSSKDEHFQKVMKTELETLSLAFAKFVSKPFFIPPPEIVLKKKGKDGTVLHFTHTLVATRCV